MWNWNWNSKDADRYLGDTHLPRWPFISLLLLFSITIGSPIFLCFIYHRRKEADRLREEVRRALAHLQRPQFSVDGRDHYILPFPTDLGGPVNTPRAGSPMNRRNISGGSIVPLLPVQQQQQQGNNGRRKTSIGERGMITFSTAAAAVAADREAALNRNFAERSGATVSPAYPETVHRASSAASWRDGAQGKDYGTLGHVMHSTYTAAQRAYRGRHKLNFWTGWMGPWLRGDGLAVIDEESVGSSRIRKGVDIVSRVSVSTAEESGTSVNPSWATPPAFERVDKREPYNPSMARSLTRRLLKFGFDKVKDGVSTPDKEEEGGKQGVWKKGGEVKKRVMERRRLESGGRLFSFQKKKNATQDQEEDVEVEVEGEEELGGADMEELEKQTSIRDFAHAFGGDVLGEDVSVSESGTVRIYRIYDPEDYSPLPEEEDKEDENEADSSMIENEEEEKVTDENAPHAQTASASTTQAEIEGQNTTGTLRGRKTLRDKNAVPGTQRMRMERNTPQNTAGRAAMAKMMDENEDDVINEGDKEALGKED